MKIKSFVVRIGGKAAGGEERWLGIGYVPARAAEQAKQFGSHDDAERIAAHYRELNPTSTFDVWTHTKRFRTTPASYPELVSTTVSR